MKFARAHLAFLFVLGAAVVAACGSDDGGAAGPASDGGAPPPGSFGFDDGGTRDAETQQLRIEPASTTVLATGTTTTVTGSAQFRALVDGQPASVEPKWSIDKGALGTIDATGLFRATGLAGKSIIRAQLGTLSASAEVTITAKISENLAGTDPATQALLRAGGSVDAAFKWLYPYDKTVFPRGLRPPVLQFGGAVPTAFYVRVTFGASEYEAFMPAETGSAARFALSPAAWSLVTQSAGATDSVVVEVTKLEGTKVSGPIRESWRIAQGSLKGIVYYNSYNSALADDNGAVLRIKPGADAELLLASANIGGKTHECVVCHSVSANGLSLVAAVDYDDNLPNGGGPVYSASFDLSGTGASLVSSDPDGRKMPFGALSPDGKWLLGNSVSPDGPDIRGLAGPLASRLYEVKTGTPVNDAYFGTASRSAVTPSFSPDGKLLVFNDGAVTDTGGVLAMLSFDDTKSPPVFSNRTPLYTSPSGVAGWPTVSPDSQSIVFHEGDSFDTGEDDGSPTLGAHHANLKWIDVATKQAVSLDALNGWEPDGAGGKRCYLPYGTAQDANMNYEPTILPAAVGGYYWVVFTSRRSYGNTIHDGPTSLNAVGDKPFDSGDEPGRGFRKKLWVAAININGAPGTDVSHPAFYLEGQELRAGNMRGFWALDRCKADGLDCTFGDECCGGFCRQVSAADGGTATQCVPSANSCSNDSEKCQVDADCCNATSGSRCLNHSCVAPTPAN